MFLEDVSAEMTFPNADSDWLILMPSAIRAPDKLTNFVRTVAGFDGEVSGFLYRASNFFYSKFTRTSCVPVAPVFDRRSLPARSTRFSLPFRNDGSFVFSLVVMHSITMQKIEWDLELTYVRMCALAKYLIDGMS